MPPGVHDEDFAAWLDSRKASRHNGRLLRLMRELGCDRLEGFIAATHAASLVDTYWVREESETLTWRDVSLYRNSFDETLSKLAFFGPDIPGSPFTATAPELTTDGQYPKCFTRKGNNEIYLHKAGFSRDEASNAGLEPYGECMASELAQMICSRAVPYTLDSIYGVRVSSCKLFTSEEYGHVPMARILDCRSHLDRILKYYAGLGAEEECRQMFVLDSITFNEDRHFGNFGVLVQNDTQEPITIAPVFDMNRALLPYESLEGLRDIGYTLSKYAPKIGDDFLQIGQELLTDRIRDTLKGLEGFRFSFRGDDVFPAERVEILEQMVNRAVEGILRPERITTQSIFPSGSFKQQKSRTCTGYIVLLDFIKMR